MLDQTLLTTACELFCGRVDREVIRRVGALVRNPYEIPYAFFEPETPLGSGQELATDVQPAARHVELAYALLLQRRPESDAIVGQHLALHATMTSLVAAFLLGDEFRLGAPALLARLTLDVPRVWHVHIPKTAGTTFARAFEASGWAIVHATDLANPDYALGDLARVLALHRLRTGVLFTGHQSLSRIAPHLMPLDTCVAFVRHPLDRATSYFNYMLTRLQDDPQHESADTRDFLARGLDPASFERTYLDSRLMIPNEQCAHLGGAPTARAAIEQARIVGCRLYDTDKVASVLQHMLGTSDSTRHNVSRPSISTAVLPAELARRILADNAEDLALYHAVLRS